MALSNSLIPGYIQVVVNPYNNSDSKKRKGIIVGGPWTDAILKFVRENGIQAIYFNSAKGWKDSDYSFLSKLDTVEELNIISSTATNLSAIEGMVSLVELSITTSTKDKVDFLKLPNLKKCYLYWWSGAESILDCVDLDTLYLDKLKVKDFSKLEKLSQLKSLTVSNSKIDTVDWLSNYQELIEFELYNCKKLSEFDAIRNCLALNKLVINGSKSLENVNFVEALADLEVLVFSDCSEIDSIHVLSKLKNLKSFSFAGSTAIEDGDLSVLETLPKLSMLMFQARKHYTHKLIKKWDWNNFNHPSRLLEKC
ncbi:leucine-rich repeat protein [Marinomonas primoryensis]|jgi:Leucine-rich repeat (LRR) protein|uniref:leucine-rich repeat protein n=1 Tax=Marinomonas primoryensis TaxID=178399 RepID=UPI003704464A